MTKPLEALINRAKHIVENGGLLARDTSLALIAALEQSDKLKETFRVQSNMFCADANELKARVEDLESQRKMAFMASNRWADKFRDAEKRIAGLEASQSAVKLPPHKFSECVNELLEGAIAYAGTQQLRAQLSTRLSNFVKPDHPAGITVQGDE